MIVEIVESGPVEIPFAFAAAPDLDDEAARIADPVRVVGAVRREGRAYAVEGEINGEVECDCNRCLAPARFALNLRFRDVFVRPVDFATAQESELEDSDLDISEFDGERIDLLEVVREQILLAIPEQVFCRPDCRGLCAECGADLNAGACACDERETDPRWAELKKLKY